MDNNTGNKNEVESHTFHTVYILLNYLNMFGLEHVRVWLRIVTYGQ